MPAQPAYGCPVDVPVSIVGGKWKLVMIFYLLQQPRRTGELRRLIPGITQKMLTQQLREHAPRFPPDGEMTSVLDGSAVTRAGRRCRR